MCSLPQPVPAAVPVSAGSVAALAQTLALLQAAQSLPGEAPGAVAKLLAQQLLVAPPPAPQAQAPAPAPARPAPPARLPVAALYGVRVPATYRPPVKAALLPLQQVTTLTPDVSPDLLYNTVSPSPAPAATPTPPPPLPAARPTPLVPVDDVDLQNYLTPVRIAHVEVRPNGHDVHSPLKLVPTSSTTAAPPPPPPPAPPAPPQPPTPPPPPAAPAPALRPYGYASKAPPVLGRVTFTQSYPDPDAEGGTPGRPGVDYPTLASIPPTTFDCKSQRYKGFFGDPETHCQVWHYCDLNGGQASFLCPNGTIFSQVALTCDWWFNVRCASTPQLYVLNERLYKYILPVMPSFPEDFTGPLVDQYLTLKFREQEQKSKAKAKGAKASSSTPKPTTAKPQLPPAQPTQNTLQDLEDDR
ncbi:hypothetical protein R5R35_014812 [Gryllus longicercus]|uniref:Chitin-binding type-2 domain-containing protein n=1 Tax=Gryllus longicercus TaxID=2509291 RepID=A0AAN9VVT7_9ORTH